MKLQGVFIVFFFTLPYFVAGLLHRCPPKVILGPACSCIKRSPSNEVVITCQGIKHAFDLQGILRNFQKYVIDKMVVQKSGKFEIIPGLFAKLTIHKIIFKEIEFGTLPMFSFLDGVHDSLEELQLNDCNVSEWVFDRGVHFAFMETVQFHNTPLPEVMTNLSFLAFPNNIRHLKMTATRIKALKNAALRKFGRLETLELSGNGITTYERSLLPQPAKRLKYLSLTNNPLKSLPENAFVLMSRLEFLSLSATHLTSLHENTFKPVWEQLQEVFFNNIFLNCNCNATWLLEDPRKDVFKRPMCRKVDGKNSKPINEVKYIDICSESVNLVIDSSIQFS